ncbi:hypothetical protein P9J64_02385 [Deltaproteobacteria bacterium IMCC39524]|nr:hypothetical protein [Deltaproteobacteria bacterium IMCC39524]
MKRLTTLCLAASLGLLATTAIADETYTCTNSSQERVVSVVYQDQEAKVPCEVRYQKDSVTETLWRAQDEVGYCEEKARAFVEKQRGWGWNCNETAAGS